MLAEKTKIEIVYVDFPSIKELRKKILVKFKTNKLPKEFRENVRFGDGWMSIRHLNGNSERVGVLSMSYNPKTSMLECSVKKSDYEKLFEAYDRASSTVRFEAHVYDVNEPKDIADWLDMITFKF